MHIWVTRSRAISKSVKIRMHSYRCTQATIAAPQTRPCRSSRPRPKRGPPPGRDGLAGAAPEPPAAPTGCNLAPARSRAARVDHERREAAFRRLRWPPRACHARHERNQRCHWRRGPRRPHTRACSGRSAHSAGPRGPQRLAGAHAAAFEGGAATPLRSAPAQRTGWGESWATRMRGPGGAEAAEKSYQVKSSQ